MNSSPDNPQQVRVARALDERRPRPRPPLMTLALIAINLLMAFAQFSASGYDFKFREIGSAPVDYALGAKVPSLIAHGEYWRLVTANFLHGDWLHLTWNMVSLLIFGFIIETFYGPARLLAIFVLSSVAGVVGSYLFTPSISLGASTGIMGLMGALLVHNFRYRKYLPERLNRRFPLFFAMLMVQLLFDQFSKQVDQFGHLGGLAGGALMAALLESRIAGPLQEEREWLPLPTALATSLALLAYGGYGLLTSLPRNIDLLRAGRTGNNLAARAQFIGRVLEQQPHFEELRFNQIEALLGLGQVNAATQEFQKLLRERPRLSSSPVAKYLRERLFAANAEAAELAMRNSQWTTALASYEYMLANTPSRFSRFLPEAHNGAAWVLVDKLEQDLERAERYAIRANTLDPNNSAYVDTLAWIYFKQNRLDEALVQQQRAIRLMERDGSPLGRAPEVRSELFYHLGAIYEKQGKTTEAREYYQRAAEALPTFAPAQEGLRRLGTPPREGAPPTAAPLPHGRPGQLMPAPSPSVRPRRPQPAIERGII